MHQVVNSHPALLAMKTQHAWFVPMLKVLLAPQNSVESRRLTMRRLTAIVTPKLTASVSVTTNFDSMVQTAQNARSSDRISPL
jgi:hypothetical protein